MVMPSRWHGKPESSAVPSLVYRRTRTISLCTAPIPTLSSRSPLQGQRRPVLRSFSSLTPMYRGTPTKIGLPYDDRTPYLSGILFYTDTRQEHHDQPRNAPQ